jgi:hypothetical protein
MVTGATCGGKTGAMATIPQANTGATPNTWAFLFNQVPPGNQTLTVTGTKMMGTATPASESIYI